MILITDPHPPVSAPAKPLPLSDREKQVADRIARGLTDKETAADLGVSKGTVRSYWMRLREKVGGATRSETILLAERAGLIDGSPAQAALAEVRDALADLRKNFPDDCQTPQSLRFRLAVDALLGAKEPGS